MTSLGKKFGDPNTPATRLPRLAGMGLVGRLPNNLDELCIDYHFTSIFGG
jgi:hypothetical protein